MGRGSLPTAALIIVFRHGVDTHVVKAMTQTRRIFGIRNLQTAKKIFENFSVEVEIARKKIISSFLGLTKNGLFLLFCDFCF
jgi:hypothetical protein